MTNHFIVNTAAFQNKKTAVEQVKYVKVAQNLGFEAIEIRSELLNGSKQELQDIAQIAKTNKYKVYYSVGDVLFNKQQLNSKLSVYLEQMHELGATHLKMNLGEFNPTNDGWYQELKGILDGSFKLYIEDNQTPIESDLYQTKAFLEQGSSLGIKYCFDIANWSWLAADVYTAAKALADFTEYIHLKNIRTIGNQKVVTSLTTGELNWREILAMLPQANYFGFEYAAKSEQLESDLQLVKQLTS
ncbi:Sugar phosphate isomerase/epimerase [Lactobacillus bombicola]|uniref:Sugar phosphate isomerase/epimerase n=1 Tax=Lactobacillus bombicola TaxID=1505723 RepID=A0A1I1SPG4_9LACO|nr:sugar phosphate isomerase/epimerase [Lactobacillus bombicola]SFD48251.1 Sugar phosphate isomerase/epimerase [Lactobacillus bombicola]